MRDAGRLALVGISKKAHYQLSVKHFYAEEWLLRN
jgi:hypothetical protein